MDIVVQEVTRQLNQVAAGATFGQDTDLRNVLGLSSLALVSVLTQLCEAFNVDMLTLTDADLAKLDTVGDLVGLFTRVKGN
ncbi:acyl carrier protein [Corallococcus interemptor]|uniref:Acyl carrier protein n=2 Tax=Corallococcus TaxID=83461 RepID=A0A3A8QPH1_9BACT|nr:acyl carrier protein [Corallococcus interemptor]RKH51785.1 acyl carrier protein [Corallococcus sp. AB050B]RKH65124.1 acyl carrier protein [Corallococcus interemptor]